MGPVAPVLPQCGHVAGNDRDGRFCGTLSFTSPHWSKCHLAMAGAPPLTPQCGHITILLRFPLHAAPIFNNTSGGMVLPVSVAEIFWRCTSLFGRPRNASPIFCLASSDMCRFCRSSGRCLSVALYVSPAFRSSGEVATVRPIFQGFWRYRGLPAPVIRTLIAAFCSAVLRLPYEGWFAPRANTLTDFLAFS